LQRCARLGLDIEIDEVLAQPVELAHTHVSRSPSAQWQSFHVRARRRKRESRRRLSCLEGPVLLDADAQRGVRLVPLKGEGVEDQDEGMIPLRRASRVGPPQGQGTNDDFKGAIQGREATGRRSGCALALRANRGYLGGAPLPSSSGLGRGPLK